ncbi:MFS transporter [Ramlibacter sp. USB13]|uniref:MFS transporter n=1 Tax=Ramlibacter cellulosilyticus TaxID=2764187 RepID=A0A923MXW4_9BURK|nr:MFS transporter [Ramlibacter cellulosilyticus]MBC5786139.1 MFS transporter [Ramlibacter cellulosilyticus]
MSIQLTALEARPVPADSYLFGPRAAWFAYAMTLGLMIMDYVDRQVIVSLFPHMKAEWGLSDTQLGTLVSIVSVTVALGALPVALFADRASRVKSIVTMAVVWSLASISCMFTRNYGQLLAARGAVGLGEAGYGSVGAALIASHFPARLRGALMAGFFASASVGSVLGVMLGGLIAARWGWQAAFGVVGVPGLVLALLYMRVRDYRTVALTPALDTATRSVGGVLRRVVHALSRSPTMLFVCAGGAAQLIVVSAMWSWLPSFLNRVHGVAPEHAGMKAAVIVLCGAAGSVAWGALVDRAGARRPRNKLYALAALCVLSMLVLALTFGAQAAGWTMDPSLQLGLIAAGSFVATCTVGPVSAIVIDVIHPGVRATGSSVLALFQNLFGLALGPVVAGALSDRLGLGPALALTPLFAIAAAAFFLRAAGTYEADAARAAEAP